MCYLPLVGLLLKITEGTKDGQEGEDVVSLHRLSTSHWCLTPICDSLLERVLLFLLKHGKP